MRQIFICVLTVSVFTLTPLLFRLGYLVRRCTWEGRPGGLVTGAFAQEILRSCLAIQCCVLDDYRAGQEYSKTIAVALLMWQPWMSTLPGCCFVEESGEAMLSRLASSCKQNSTLRKFIDIRRLYVTLPAPSSQEHCSRGTVREQLVTILSSRLRGLIQDTDGKPFPRLTSSKTGTWADAFPSNWRQPPRLKSMRHRQNWETVFRSAMRLLVGGPQPSAQIVSWLDANAGTVSSSGLDIYQGALSALGVAGGTQVGAVSSASHTTAPGTTPVFLHVLNVHAFA